MKRQPTTQQITWFLDAYRNNQIDLDPPYQRKSVWSLKDRKFFLDTIFRNYPAPPVFIHRNVDDNGYVKYFVVDGKQRLETIFQYADNKISIDADFGDSNLNGKKFKQLSVENKRKFWDYTIVVDFIDTIEGTNIEEVFDRVNRNARNLQPQELRHARFNGWFISLVEDEAQMDFWWTYKISTRDRDKRMKNVQFISELVLVIIDNEIQGFDHAYLDTKYAMYDDIDEIMELNSFNATDCKSRIETIKSFLEEANKVNNCIVDYVAGSNSNFYTLWAYLHLYNTMSSSDFAMKYINFMEAINNSTESDLNIDTVDDYIGQYYRNLKGANTEFQQRNERLSALRNFLEK